MILNLHKREWDYLHHLIKGKDKPFITLTNITQGFCRSTKTLELYGSCDSIINLFDNSISDFELKDYSIVQVHFLNQDDQLICLRELANVDEPFHEIEHALFKSCIYCFYAVKKGTVSHNVGMKKKLYCPKCGKEYKINLMFTKVHLVFKRNKAKHVGDTIPFQLTASTSHKISSALFKDSLTSSEYGIIPQNFQQSLQIDLTNVFTSKWDAKVNKVPNSESLESFSSQLTNCNYFVKDIQLKE